MQTLLTPRLLMISGLSVHGKLLFGSVVFPILIVRQGVSTVCILGGRVRYTM
jgi:hypothetical protein